MEWLMSIEMGNHLLGGGGGGVSKKGFFFFLNSHNNPDIQENLKSTHPIFFTATQKAKAQFKS